MLSWNRADVLVVSLLAVSIAISAIAASAIFTPLTNQPIQSTQQATSPSSGLNSSAANSNRESSRAVPSTAPYASTQTAPQSGPANSPTFGPSSGKTSPAPATPAPQSQPENGSTASAVYHSSPYFLPATWGAFIGALVWRGKIRTAWSKHGYGYDTFRLMARMRGSPIRVKLLGSVSSPKNRLQLANEFQVDWKTIDNHMQMLEKSGLVEQRGVVGTTKYYSLTEHGRRVLSLLSDASDDSNSVPTA